MATRADLESFTPGMRFLVGIDSDGCAFDTMEIKWKECFIPRAIEHFGLQPVASCARRCLEYTNLQSRSRGVNRFFGLLESLDLLERMATVRSRGFQVPSMTAVRAWAAGNSQPTTEQLESLVTTDPDPGLAMALAWSRAANKDIRRMVHDIPPFPQLPGILAALNDQADILVVSSTPVEALDREWQEHDIARHVSLICGQETGSKADMLRIGGALLPRDQVLMIGDAPGDLRAAQVNATRFFPIIPGREEASWQRFADEAMDRFLAGTYAGDYENTLITDFTAGLPAEPDFF